MYCIHPWKIAAGTPNKNLGGTQRRAESLEKAVNF
jgi:hypothetical protein